MGAIPSSLKLDLLYRIALVLNEGGIDLGVRRAFVEATGKAYGLDVSDFVALTHVSDIKSFPVTLEDFLAAGECPDCDCDDDDDDDADEVANFVMRQAEAERETADILRRIFGDT